MPTTYDSRRYALVNRWDPRHMRTVRRVVAPKPGWRVLDVGCGRGHLTMRLQELGCDATGVDANPQAAAVAVTSGIETMRAERLGFPDGTFDLVVSVHAIEHIPPLEQTLAEMARGLKPGGRLLLIYPAEPIKGIFPLPPPPPRPWGGTPAPPGPGPPPPQRFWGPPPPLKGVTWAPKRKEGGGEGGG